MTTQLLSTLKDKDTGQSLDMEVVVQCLNPWEIWGKCEWLEAEQRFIAFASVLCSADISDQMLGAL